MGPPLDPSLDLEFFLEGAKNKRFHVYCGGLLCCPVLGGQLHNFILYLRIAPYLMSFTAAFCFLEKKKTHPTHRKEEISFLISDKLKGYFAKKIFAHGRQFKVSIWL
jgi:hypothetical protein